MINLSNAVRHAYHNDTYPNLSFEASGRPDPRALWVCHLDYHLSFLSCDQSSDIIWSCFSPRLWRYMRATSARERKAQPRESAPRYAEDMRMSIWPSGYTCTSTISCMFILLIICIYCIIYIYHISIYVYIIIYTYIHIHTNSIYIDTWYTLHIFIALPWPHHGWTILVPQNG